jgi:hypothetical protein
MMTHPDSHALRETLSLPNLRSRCRMSPDTITLSLLAHRIIALQQQNTLSQAQLLMQ